MRIISGRLGGRQFNSPHSSATHPMSDKIRGALFNMLGDIGGLTVLDAFAGTGALAFEAMSRGAKEAIAIESDRQAQRVLRANCRLLGLQSRVQVVETTAGNWHKTAPSDKLFDLVLLDPPYHNLQQGTLQQLSARVVPDGLLVLSWPIDTEIPAFNGFTQIEHRTYGDAQLIFYRKDA